MESLRVASTGQPDKLLAIKPSFKILKFLILLASWSFLAYKLLTFHQFNDIARQWEATPLSRLWWLTGVFILLPLNWLLEALKWKMLTARVQTITMNTSMKAVLSGISTGFFTPNRVGELVGRIAFLEPGNRKAGITLSVVNSMTQNTVMALFGIPACIFFFSCTAGKLQPDIVWYCCITLASILFLGLIYFTLPRWSRHIEKSKLFGTVKKYTDCLSTCTAKDLLQIIGVSGIRYAVFCTQLYFMLRFFGIVLTPWQALMSIPTSYLFVTFTPSLAFSEAAVRSSYAVLIIGAFSGQAVNIALAGVCIWAINFIIPMLVGSMVMMKKSV